MIIDMSFGQILAMKRKDVLRSTQVSWSKYTQVNGSKALGYIVRPPML